MKNLCIDIHSQNLSGGTLFRERNAMVDDSGKLDEQNIELLKDQLVEKLSPESIYLFGSFAEGAFSDDSDYDFFIVVDDGCDLKQASLEARRAVRNIKRRPVDIVVGTKSGFERRKHQWTVEREVYHRGVLLYDRSGSAAVV